MKAMLKRPGEHCPQCGSILVESAGPNRFKKYMGEDGYEVPADLVYPACLTCGAEWPSPRTTRALSAAFDAQHLARAARGRLKEPVVGEVLVAKSAFGVVQGVSSRVIIRAIETVFTSALRSEISAAAAWQHVSVIVHGGTITEAPISLPRVLPREAPISVRNRAAAEPEEITAT
jgi:hypothetical protein